MLGEDLLLKTNNLFRLIYKFVSGKKNKLSIFGDYLQKKNDTYIRDVIHMMDMLMLI